MWTMASRSITLLICLRAPAWVQVRPLRLGFCSDFTRSRIKCAISVAVAIALFLIGFFVMVNRRKALTQVLGLLSLENGLFLAAISLTYGMPLVVEIGIFFDVLVAVLVLGILVFRIGETFDSMDVSKLRKLRE